MVFGVWEIGVWDLRYNCTDKLPYKYVYGSLYVYRDNLQEPKIPIPKLHSQILISYMSKL